MTYEPQVAGNIAIDETQSAFQTFARLSKAGQASAVDYLNYLARKEAEERVKHLAKGAEAIRKIIGDDIPWASEEEMIADLADFRRKRMQA